MTYTLRTLTDHITKIDAEQAPGSETRLLGEYLDDMRLATGVGAWPVGNHDDVDIEPEVSAWWIAAYAVQAEVEEAGTLGWDVADLLDDMLTAGHNRPSIRFTVQRTGEALGMPIPKYYTTATDAATAAAHLRSLLIEVLTGGSTCGYGPIDVDAAEAQAAKDVTVTVDIVEAAK